MRASLTFGCWAALSVGLLGCNDNELSKIGDGVGVDDTDLAPTAGSATPGVPGGWIQGTGTGTGSAGSGTPTSGTPGTGPATGTGSGTGTGNPGGGTPVGTYTVTTGILIPGTWTGTLGITADTAGWTACDWADHVAGFLDAYQTPNDDRVLFCHGQNGNWTFVNSSISSCLSHANHNNDIFPTSICDS